jgi:hypothetical protein
VGIVTKESYIDIDSSSGYEGKLAWGPAGFGVSSRKVDNHLQNHDPFT